MKELARLLGLTFAAAVVVSLVAAWPIVARAAEGAAGEAAIPITTGAGGLTLGGVGVYFLLHGRLKAQEAGLAAIGQQLPAVLAQVSSLVRDLEQLGKTMREDALSYRNKVHDVRNSIQKHEARLIRLEERHNITRDALDSITNSFGLDVALPREILDEPTGPIVDTGRHRRVGR